MYRTQSSLSPHLKHQRITPEDYRRSLLKIGRTERNHQVPGLGVHPVHDREGGVHPHWNHAHQKLLRGNQNLNDWRQSVPESASGTQTLQGKYWWKSGRIVKQSASGKLLKNIAKNVKSSKDDKMMVNYPSIVTTINNTKYTITVLFYQAPPNPLWFILDSSSNWAISPKGMGCCWLSRSINFPWPIHPPPLCLLFRLLSLLLKPIPLQPSRAPSPSTAWLSADGKCSGQECFRSYCTSSRTFLWCCPISPSNSPVFSSSLTVLSWKWPCPHAPREDVRSSPHFPWKGWN